MKEMLSSDFFTHKKTFSYNGFIDISKISRQWFSLMVKLNESRRLANFFSEDSLIDDPNDAKNKVWQIKSTEYTRYFLTTGIAIFDIYNQKQNILDKYKHQETMPVDRVILVKDKDLESKLDKLKQYQFKDGLYIENVEKWPGCGMALPEKVRIRLNPDIVWPIFEAQIKQKSSDKLYKIKIGNSTNQINWSYEEIDIVTKLTQKDEIFISGQTKDCIDNNCLERFDEVFYQLQQGATKVKVKFKANEYEFQKDTALLVLPYTCPAFDILTEINFDGTNDIVLTTT
ncbi:hypothetical protein H0A36_13055 [Endozoicomonas sp. SM1973]|uniref:Uncharacterized protein n=1 Tax=Spartinivicinus marinus TaxID=2994442 RepID=A0A853I0K0_9GAMM|nr:hypothetical protein [Spartinivicinus marinus]MCX4029676.1 hypothetical protein [Spartinivicinus marinus]NYZ66943.1 hypothetical protein [Spartinivicinus marinus]